jgi:hypothetical protein
MEVKKMIMFQKQEQTVINTQVHFCVILCKIRCWMFEIFWLDISSFSFVKSCMNPMASCLFNFEVFIFCIKLIADPMISEYF